METPPPTHARPYVGVSGLVSPLQQSHLETLAAKLLPADRALLLGVKATHKTQYDGSENRYGAAWYPVGHQITSAATRSSSMLVAQVYLDAEHVGDAAYRQRFMARLLQRTDQWLTGVQFDLLPWHTDRAIHGFLADLRSQRPGLKILLQCHGPAMTELGPMATARALAALSCCVDYILFDASHGTGTRLDTAALTPFLDCAYENTDLAGLGLGVAGGLSASVVTQHLPALLHKYPDLSWDAEGALHPAQPDGSRPLDLSLVEEYLRASATLLAHVHQSAPLAG